jgi:hypothetical protein
LTDPSPWPLDEPFIVSQPAVELAVHEHSRGVVTLSVPVPPDAETFTVFELMVTPQRVTVDGAVADVVEDDDPQAVTAAAVAAIKTIVRDRMK